MIPGPMRIACFATQGTGSNDEDRIRALLGDLEPVVCPFDHHAKMLSAVRLLGTLVRDRPDLVVMEGTGLGGGLTLLAARGLAGVRYIVSTGDAVGPFMASQRPGLGIPFGLYERLLLRCSAGVIAWTPYLVGRALTLGAPRAMTAAGWAAQVSSSPPELLRGSVREELGLPQDALVFGIVGSLAWSSRRGYCYGLELVRALRATAREDLRILIVGGGDGAAVLEREGGGDPRLVLAGPVERRRVPEVLAAIDVASLPQSVDGVGAFRYSTKLSEYLAAGLPVVTGEIPLAYDLDGGWLWRLPGDAPWEDRYVAALAGLMQELQPAELEQRRANVPRAPEAFREEDQRRRVAAFVGDLLAARQAAG